MLEFFIELLLYACSLGIGDQCCYRGYEIISEGAVLLRFCAERLVRSTFHFS